MRQVLYTTLLCISLAQDSPCIAATPAPAAGSPLSPTELANAKILERVRDAVEVIANAMPAWDADTLGKFERPEIELVKADIWACRHANTPDEFMAAALKLRADKDALIALDAELGKEHVL